MASLLALETIVRLGLQVANVVYIQRLPRSYMLPAFCLITTHVLNTAQASTTNKLPPKQPCDKHTLFTITTTAGSVKFPNYPASKCSSVKIMKNKTISKPWKSAQWMTLTGSTMTIHDWLAFNNDDSSLRAKSCYVTFVSSRPTGSRTSVTQLPVAEFCACLGLTWSNQNKVSLFWPDSTWRPGGWWW